MKLHQAVAAALLTFLINTLSQSASAAAPTNEQANQQIDNAINTHYASADIDLAEKKLLEIIKACGTSCSPAVRGRAWMYVGIVRGSGRDDVAGAQEAFKAAKAADPNVKLDDLFATDLVKKVFAQTPGPAGAAGAAAMPLMGDMQNRVGQAPEVTSIQCSLQVTEVETQRPIPIACRTGAGAVSVMLSYRHESSTRWRPLPLLKHGNAFSAEIPCTDTAQLGVLSYRVQALDAQGKEVDALGTESEPQEINLVEKTDAAPPAIPGQPPPASCRPKKVEEPAGPKLGSYGDACSDGSQCQGGLSCSNGKCTADVSCESDSECFSGTCVDSICVTPNDDCEGAACEKASRVPGNWFGIQGGMDIGYMASGSNVCGQKADVSYSCFEDGEPYRGLPNQNYGGDIEGGFVLATARVMLSYERVISSILSVEGRFGFAFNGGPESSQSQGGDGSKFLPFHAEGRLKLYFSKVYREDGSGLKGPSGFATLGGGLAQVDEHVVVPVAECREDSQNQPITPGQSIMISQAEQNCITSSNRALEIKELDVYQRLGQGFVTAGLGFRYGFDRRWAAIVSVNGQFMLPSSGLTISPSIGVLAGF